MEKFTTLTLCIYNIFFSRHTSNMCLDISDKLILKPTGGGGYEDV